MSTAHEVTTGHEPPDGRATRQPTLWQKLVPSHLTGIILGVIGFFLADWIVHLTTPEEELMSPDKALLWAFIGLAIGWLHWGWRIQLSGALDSGYCQSRRMRHPYRGPGYYRQYWRYFRWNTDHKIIGIQYLVLTLFMLAIGGTLAMLIRLNLLVPGTRFFPPNTYETVVTMHGMLMIATMFSIIVGPFGNFFVPILIGARDMAFPRLNALSWHSAGRWRCHLSADPVCGRCADRMDLLLTAVRSDRAGRRRLRRWRDPHAGLLLGWPYQYANHDYPDARARHDVDAPAHLPLGHRQHGDPDGGLGAFLDLRVDPGHA